MKRACINLAMLAIVAGGPFLVRWWRGPSAAEVEILVAQLNSWSDIQLERAGGSLYRGTAVSERGERLNVEVTTDKQSIESRWTNANGSGSGRRKVSTGPVQGGRRRDPNERLQFWLQAMLVVVLIAVNVAYQFRPQPKPGEARRRSFLLDFDYELRGWRGVLVVLFYVGLIAVLVGAGLWAKKLYETLDPYQPDPHSGMSRPL